MLKTLLENVVKAGTWTNDETALLCEIWVDSKNGFLQTLESKALFP